MFDMGADIGAVDIDQVSVVPGHVGTERLNHPAINLLSNGGFDSADGWSGNALNVIDGISRANIEAAGNPWDVNLSGEVSLVTGASYTVVFDAKGTDGRTLLAGIGDTSEPYANNTNVIILSQDWQTYTLHLDANGLQGGLSRVMFDMGADTGAVDIDNVAVFAGHVGTKTLNYPPGNLLPNGGFDSLADWYGNAFNLVDGMSRANVEAVGDPWDVNLSGAVELLSGVDYTVTFMARGAEGRELFAGIGEATEPHHNHSVSEFKRGWQSYTLHLNASDGTRVPFAGPAGFYLTWAPILGR